jgi:hypothetical protein
MTLIAVASVETKGSDAGADPPLQGQHADTRRATAISLRDGEGANGCEAAKSLQDVRLLSLEAPRLPLASCTHPAECRCTYRHFDDRRMGPRRARERNELSDPWSATDRRRSIGRRSTD